MDKIDLDAVISSVNKRRTVYIRPNDYMKDCMKEAIHQALVSASENAKVIEDSWGDYSVDKQSILDVDQLIV